MLPDGTDATFSYTHDHAGRLLTVENHQFGQGTFGTDELIGRIEATGLRDVVRHRWQG